MPSPTTTQSCDALARKLPSLLVTNANHLTNKINLLNGLLDDSNVNIAFITETWFNEANSTINLCKLNKHYHKLSATRNDRGEEKEGGGALILVAKSYASKCLPILNHYPPPPSWFAETKRAKEQQAKPLAIDLKIVKLKISQLPRGYSSVIAACVYLAEFSNDKARQKAAIYQTTHAIASAAKSSSLGTKPLVIVAGDFNGANTSYLTTVLKLHKLNNAATHKRGGTLDLVFTNSPKCYKTQVWSPLGASDHNVIYCYADQLAYKSLLPRPTSVLVRGGHVRDTVNSLRNADWSHITRLACTSPQLAADKLYTLIKTTEDLCQPLKPKKARVDQPWMTPAIQQKIKKRRALLLDGKHVAYAQLAKEIDCDIHRRKRTYFKRKFSSSNPSYWNVVNDFRELKQSANEDFDLATSLNEGFYSVWSGVAQPDLTVYTTSICPPLLKPVFNQKNVELSMNDLNASSPGPDGISAKLLKSARLELSATLAKLFNDWLNIGFVPKQWRAASITPIAKVDHPSEWSDYRPISLTSNVCKVFEKVLVRNIIRKTTSIWASNNQHGFLPGRSTVDAAAKVFFDLEKAFDQKTAALAIFFDFAKAFDLVPHDILLRKLSTILPLRIVRWIACYLSERTQQVRVGKISTDWKRVEAGVIQGSVLGPVLFLLFIADINTYLPEGVRFEKYADDIIACIIGSAIHSDLPQRVANAVEKWCVDNHMRLNVSKSKVMHFRTCAATPPPVITIGNSPLGAVEVYKYLGFHITNTFDSSQQWLYIKPLISKNIYLINQLASIGLNVKILVNVFKSLVLSQLRYSSTLLVSCSNRIQADIQVLQNTLLRAIGITREGAKNDHNITDASDFILASCLQQIIRILSIPSHPLTVSLPPSTARHSAFPFTIPKRNTESFKKNAVMITLVHLRDNVYGTSRSKPAPAVAPQLPHLPPTSSTSARGRLCTNPSCKLPNKLWLRLDLHEPACRAANPPPV